jgi:ATP-dependent DNA ligase
VPVCVYASDLMEIQGRNVRGPPLYLRRAQLRSSRHRSPDQGATCYASARLASSSVFCQSSVLKACRSAAT